MVSKRCASLVLIPTLCLQMPKARFECLLAEVSSKCKDYQFNIMTCMVMIRLALC